MNIRAPEYSNRRAANCPRSLEKTRFFWVPPPGLTGQVLARACGCGASHRWRIGGVHWCHGARGRGPWAALVLYVEVGNGAVEPTIIKTSTNPPTFVRLWL